jgi:RNA polymerase sigma-70 factor, ECF subfamily
MNAANAGDRAAYRQLLVELAPILRANARRALERARCGNADLEDIVQETLLAIHLKRHTWRESEPLGPWIAAISRNKLIDAMRRRSRKGEVSLEDCTFVPTVAEAASRIEARDLERMLAGLRPAQREVVLAITIGGGSVKETASRLQASEGAVRVTLHRALRALARIYQRSLE